MTAQDAAMLRRATPVDSAAMETYLAQHAATSMFLRSNLAAHGTDDTDDPVGTTFYVPAEPAQINAVFGVTNHGYLMAQAPGASPALWAAFAAQLVGRDIKGMTGVPEQVQTCLRATGLSEGPFTLLADEPLYHLRIADMVAMPGQVRAPEAQDVPLLEQWYTAYETDTGLAAPSATPTEQARARAAQAVAGKDVVLLEEDGEPRAMAGINARLPDVVQIGGVFTPDGQRGNGYARRAVAGLLRRCAAEGVTQAILFANNAAAAHTYEALGFRLVGQYRVALLRTPARIGARP